MELKTKDVMELLGATENEVLKYIKTRNLPAHRINHQNRFNKQELKEWIIRNGITVSEKFLDLKLAEAPVSIAGLIKKGTIISGVSGKNTWELLNYAVSRMQLPDGLKKETILSSLLEREEMMPTGVGRGIAIPHPRNPIITDIGQESITVCSLAEPVDYRAIDGKKVHTMFIVLSANPRRHLEILSKLLYICQQQEFINILGDPAVFGSMLSYVEGIEALLAEKKK